MAGRLCGGQVPVYRGAADAEGLGDLGRRLDLEPRVLFTPGG